MLTPVIIAHSDKVIDGENYKANIYMAYIPEVPLIMNVNGQAIEVKDGIGKVKLIAGKPGKYNFSGAVTIEIDDSRDTILPFSGEYKVIKELTNR